MAHVKAYPEPLVRIGPNVEQMAKGPFAATWDSLQQYASPSWFHEAKFGIWAHWGPQCQPEYGDWYARHLYQEDEPQGQYHRERYGHPSRFGFKDVINTWKAERWDPEALLDLYVHAGARYFVALANHHDNFDTYDSTYQPWNSVNLGPRKDLIAGWARAARQRGLRFGVSVHAAHAWTWYETAQGADARGPLAGVPYDGRLSKANGKGHWWEGYDPQDLYAQNHPVSRGRTIHDIWGWDPANSFCRPEAAYCEKFYNRTIQLINKYEPDLVYFDDTVLPLWPVSDAGLKIAAHFYNRNVSRRGGNLEAVLTGKILDELQRQCMVWDIERGQSNRIEPFVWQADTCIGEWHYDSRVFGQHRYKSAQTVIQTLADIVSKNGSFLLSVPLRGEGNLDSDEMAIIERIAAWMAINGECIYGTRPWKVYGEGPALMSPAPLSAEGFNEGKGIPFTFEDIRFTAKGTILYAICLGAPTRRVRIASLGRREGLLERRIAAVALLGSDEKLRWEQEGAGLIIAAPRRLPAPEAAVFKVSLA